MKPQAESPSKSEILSHLTRQRFREGYNSKITAYVIEILGREPRTIKDCTIENRQAWV